MDSLIHFCSTTFQVVFLFVRHFFVLVTTFSQVNLECDLCGFQLLFVFIELSGEISIKIDHILADFSHLVLSIFHVFDWVSDKSFALNFSSFNRREYLFHHDAFKSLAFFKLSIIFLQIVK